MRGTDISYVSIDFTLSLIVISNRVIVNYIIISRCFFFNQSVIFRNHHLLNLHLFLHYRSHSPNLHYHKLLSNQSKKKTHQNHHRDLLYHQILTFSILEHQCIYYVVIPYMGIMWLSLIWVLCGYPLYGYYMVIPYMGIM